MKLTEIHNRDDDPDYYESAGARQIRIYLQTMGLQPGQYEIQDDGSIDVFDDVGIPVNETIRYPFSMIDGSFDVSDCPKVTSFTNFPYRVTGALMMARSGIRSLAGIHKMQDDLIVNGSFYIDDEMTNVLGIVRLGCVQRVIVTSKKRPTVQFNIAHGDIHKFQEELIDAGLAKLARL